MSHIIRSKLFSPFLQELSRKIDNNYPTLNSVIDNANSIFKLLRPREIKRSETVKQKAVDVNKFPDNFDSNVNKFNFKNVKDTKFISHVRKSTVTLNGSECKFCERVGQE